MDGSDRGEYSCKLDLRFLFFNNLINLILHKMKTDKEKLSEYAAPNILTDSLKTL